jgi:hypothetical protein
VVSLFTFISITNYSSAISICGVFDQPECIFLPPLPPISSPATANSVEANTQEDTSVSITLSSTSHGATGTIVYSIVSGPATGTLSDFNANTGTVTYTPSVNFYSTSTPVTFVFGVSQDGSTVSTSTVSISVSSVNDAPVITLSGANPTTVTVGTDYVDPGATCTDVEDGVLDVITSISYPWDGEHTLRAGDTYTIYYSCHDSSEQENSNARVGRSITVIDTPAPVVSTGGGLLWVPTPTGSFSSSPIAYSTPTTGVVLGASTTCGIYAKDFLRKGGNNDIESVKKLQQFLNDHQNAGLIVNGIFDIATENALKAFQTAHAAEILKPWQINKATGIFYLTTRVYVNNLMCPALKLPTPTILVPMSFKDR